jgi:hypothetical protein
MRNLLFKIGNLVERLSVKITGLGKFTYMYFMYCT